MRQRFIRCQERMPDQKVPLSAKALFSKRDFLETRITSLKPHRFRIIQQLGTPISCGTYWGVHGRTRGAVRFTSTLKVHGDSFTRRHPVITSGPVMTAPLVKVNPFFRALYAPKASFLVSLIKSLVPHRRYRLDISAPLLWRSFFPTPNAIIN